MADQEASEAIETIQVPSQLDTSRSACPSPHGFRNKVGRVLWGICWWTLFRPSPRPLFRYRVVLLRLFGADVTSTTRIDPTARIWAPWNLAAGTETSVGHHADIYNVARIELGKSVTVSQYSYLCAASHDLTDPNMVLTSAPIVIENDAWVCARAFLGPGVTLGSGAVVGACGVVVKDVDPWTIVAGNPVKVIRKRELTNREGNLS